MPHLVWLGRDAILDHHRSVPVGALREIPELGIPGLGPGHSLIEGDNLLALGALLPRYRERVDCVYIDPPYNTGNEGWAYNDNVNNPTARAWLEREVGRDDLSRHDAWLCLMQPRLALLHELLRPDGVLFMSIDDTELGHALLLLDGIFGAGNRLGVLTWLRKKKGSHLDRHLRRMTEFVIAYAKDLAVLPPLYGEPAYAGKWQPLVKRTNPAKQLRFAPGIVRTTLADGAYPAGPRGDGGTALRMDAPFTVQAGTLSSELLVTGRFVWTQRTLDRELAAGTTVALSRAYGLNVLRHDQADKVKRPSTLLDAVAGIGTNEDASKELMDIFAAERGAIFAFPKPVSLVSHLLRTVTQGRRNAIILDAFAGSGTTGHAVMALNAADGGARECVLVQLGQDQADGVSIARSITRERLARVSAGYTDGAGNQVLGLGQSWRFCHLDGHAAPS